jgi:hypothetical protein
MPLTQITNENFIQFVCKNRSNLLYLLFAIILSPVLWLMFKHYYPYPNVIFDSYYYIQAAILNSDVNAWPIGYSKFLRLIGLFSHSPNVLLTTQYFFLVLSFLFFFFSLRFFLQLGKWISLILFLFLLLNPIFFYTCNLILSDTLFTGLSILWFTQLLWIVCRPRPYMVFTHAILLVITFSTRYSALYYPLAACLFFILSPQRVSFKIAGIGLQFLLVGCFILYTIHRTEVTFGVKEFSPFGSWKIASNALYMYGHVKPEKSEQMPVKFQPLEKMVRQYFDNPHEKIELMDADPTWGSYYMFIYPPSPLIGYMQRKYGASTLPLDYKQFAPMGPLYKDYGNYLIRKYPAAFAQYVVWPNVKLYAVPHPEVFADSINPFYLRKDTLGTYVKTWFGLTNITVPVKKIRLRSLILSPYPILNTLVHILFVTAFLGFFLLDGYKRIRRPYSYALLAIAVLWLGNFFFGIITAGGLLRYQLFITVVEFSFALFFIEFIARSDSKEYPLLKGDSV